MRTNKGFISGKVLLLMALILSFVSFCLLGKLIPTTNTTTKQKSKTDIKKANPRGCFGDKLYTAYNLPKTNQVNQSNLDRHVVKYFSASQQELDKRDIKMTFNWGRPNPWPIPKFTNNSKCQPNQSNQNK